MGPMAVTTTCTAGPARCPLGPCSLCGEMTTVGTTTMYPRKGRGWFITSKQDAPIIDFGPFAADYIDAASGAVGIGDHFRPGLPLVPPGFDPGEDVDKGDYEWLSWI